MHADHRPTGETSFPTPARELPVWWLMLTADDFNALQPLVTSLELLPGKAVDITRRWLTEECHRLRTWYENQPEMLVYGGQVLKTPGVDSWSLDLDAIPLMLALAMTPAHNQVVMGADIRARLVDLVFRIARHATQGRVGSPIIPEQEL